MVERKILLCIILFIFIPVLSVIGLLISVISYRPPEALSISSGEIAKTYTAFGRNFDYAALPSQDNNFKYEIYSKDARAELVRQFLAQYNSPLEAYSQYIVDTADKYKLDFRLVPAIAMQESNLCKRIPEGSHNCWGFGIYGDKVTRFENYFEAIDTVAKTLGTKYKEKGLDEPYEIMTRYTPSSNGSWAHGVTTFMGQMQ